MDLDFEHRLASLMRSLVRHLFSLKLAEETLTPPGENDWISSDYCEHNNYYKEKYGRFSIGGDWNDFTRSSWFGAGLQIVVFIPKMVLMSRIDGY